jgi:hypothetical protein
MPKNIVVFSDGTGQDGGVRPEQNMSNIYKMYRACRVAPDTAINPKEQVTLYDPGLGTDTSATGWTNIRKRVQKLHASVVGRGITVNIIDCYEFIINHYAPGDRVFLFGFSRGAYTVRSVANLLMLCGVPTKAGEAPLQKFRRSTRDIAEEAVVKVLEHGAGHPRADFEAERLELARRFQEQYGSKHESGEKYRSNVAPYFIGVFDTVAALGRKGLANWAIKFALIVGAAILGAGIAAPIALIGGAAVFWGGSAFWPTFLTLTLLGALALPLSVWLNQRRSLRKEIRDFPEPGDRKSHTAEWRGANFDRLLSRFVTYARSANAIDETRADFARVKWGTTMDAPEMIDGHERLKQVWFSGNHSDIGGSYPEAESRLSDIALVWMIEEATVIPHPLKIGPVYANGKKIASTGGAGTELHLHPADDGLQHCEVTAMKDMLDRRMPTWVRKYTGWLGYSEEIRDIGEASELHPTVITRFTHGSVQQCSGIKAYKPPALSNHQLCKAFYSSSSEEGSA